MSAQEEIEKKKQTIHTTISQESEAILNKFCYDKRANPDGIFKTKSQAIEKALELLDEHYNPEKADLQTIWNRTRDELNMVLVGKATFLAYISGDYTKAFEQNIAIEILEWYARMSVVDMDLDTLLKSIKSVWLAANYFKKIEIVVGSKGNYQMLFSHDLHSVNYSKYWGNYFKTLLKKEKGCKVEFFARNSSLTLIISSSKNI